MSPLLIVLGIVVILVIYTISLYNGLVTLRNMAKAAWKQVDVQLKRRYDLIPNLVEAVKGSMSYEQETLTKVISARNAAYSATTPAQVSKAEGELGGALSRLMAVMEAYPNLKAEDNVAQLMEELSTTENQVAFTRQYYNDTVMRYNTKIQVFPSNIFAGMFNFTQEEYFEITNAAEREAPKVNLSLK